MVPSFFASPPGRRLDLSGPTRAANGNAIQLGLDDIGVPLADVTFVVVDLETTGSSPSSCEITEIGAVKVRGGELVAEFQTLIDPGAPVPPMITVLTGITDAMLAGAPSIEDVLPTFVEFAGFGPHTVLVAHNARFDVSFLRAAAERHQIPWPGPQVLDTVALARRVVTRDEAPNHKLGTLAALFGAATSPDHRALHDARATVDVLHALLGRLGPLGVSHLEDLRTVTDPVPHHRRRKATLADGLPATAGVYQFRGPAGEVLYVGKATNLYRRVRSYFTAGEKRRRIGEMLDLTREVAPLPCATELEAAVRELRLIAELDPPYNTRSRRPARRPWLRLTQEPFPRLSIVRSVPLDQTQMALGPFTSRSAAESAMAALHETFRLRQCTPRLPQRPNPRASACILAEMQRCGAPCVGGQDIDSYQPVVNEVAKVFRGDVTPVVTAVQQRMRSLATEQRYEEAATHRDRLAAFLRGARRSQQLEPLWRSPEIVAARRRGGGGWEAVVMRYGRFAGTCLTAHGEAVMPAIETLRATAEEVAEPETAMGAAIPAETELLASWLEDPATRLVTLEPGQLPLACPVGGAASVTVPGG